MSAEKELLMNELKAKINPRMGFILASYDKLSANKMAEFRETLVKTGGDFFAVKKRVFLKAAGNFDASGSLGYELGELKGHVALVMTKNSFVETTKALYAFRKENSENLHILGGHFEGKKCSSKDIEMISELPSVEVMRAQFLGLLEAPMSQTLAVIEALLTSVMHCIENKCEKESKN